MLALLAFLALQDLPIEPTTQVDVDAVVKRYKAATFDISVDANGKLTCTPDQKIGSAQLSILTCLSAADCISGGARDNAALLQCVEKGKPEILKDFRRDWLKAHPAEVLMGLRRDWLRAHGQ